MFDPADPSVVVAVERDLEALSRRDEALARGSLAMTALALARELDKGNSATSKSMCAKALVDVMDRLLELAPPEQEKGELHDIRARLAVVRAGGAGT